MDGRLGPHLRGSSTIAGGAADGWDHAANVSFVIIERPFLRLAGRPPVDR